MSSNQAVNYIKSEGLNSFEKEISPQEFLSRSETNLIDKHSSTSNYTNNSLKSKKMNSHSNDKHKSQHKLNKYHYHLKNDKIYDEKTLKLCGRCTTPANLSNDLVQLQRFIKRAASNDMISLDNKLDAKQDKKIDNHDDEKITLKALDLTTERESGLNHPILIIPAELFQYKQLRRLHLDRNQIKTIPELLGVTLVNLEILTLSNNLLNSLPNSFGNLKKLTSLHLASNTFETFPQILIDLVTLNFLDMSDNQLVEISHNIGSLINLQTLMLFNNCLKELPDSLEKLSKLETLWIGNNQLKKFPSQLLKLENLDWEEFMLSTHLDGNPLLEPPTDVCIQGMKSIRDYLKKNKITN